jgi:lipid II:glycine glycyltransferase (peptidoglycan interpeptide bridge formation enzyme)
MALSLNPNLLKKEVITGDDLVKNIETHEEFLYLEDRGYSVSFDRTKELIKEAGEDGVELLIINRSFHYEFVNLHQQCSDKEILHATTLTSPLKLTASRYKEWLVFRVI